MNNDAIYTWATYRTLDCQAAGVSIKALPGQIGGWYFYNSATSVRYVKLYDKATAPASTDMPLLTIPLPAGAGANILSDAGIDFTQGIGVRCTQLLADTDATAPSANDVQANVLYR